MRCLLSPCRVRTSARPPRNRPPRRRSGSCHSARRANGTTDQISGERTMSATPRADPPRRANPPRGGVAQDVMIVGGEEGAAEDGGGRAHESGEDQDGEERTLPERARERDHAVCWGASFPVSSRQRYIRT